MQLGVNVPNFGPGTDPGVLREWARIVEGLGFDLLMVSDHLAITPDVAEQYPEPFYEPFTTLSWLAGITFAPRIALRLTTALVDDPERPAGVGTIEQILDDLDQLRLLGADAVVLDPYHGDPEETRRPRAAWQALTAVATYWRTPS